MPLEGIDAPGQHADHGIVAPGVVQLDAVPADLSRRSGADARAHGAGDQLCAEADAEKRHLAVERLEDERRLLGEPRVLGVLIGVHCAAEDHDRVVPAGRVRTGAAVDRDPALEPVAALLDECPRTARRRPSSCLRGRSRGCASRERSASSFGTISDPLARILQSHARSRRGRPAGLSRPCCGGRRRCFFILLPTRHTSSPPGAGRFPLVAGVGLTVRGGACWEAANVG